ncbi:branched-chain amino acid transporter permease [Breznakiella homolactica]|uniref:AzlD domain-containing protein n=1 Tax=Breznakiella homolactica TaxID=2798577 RepID=A0A7T7XQZ8_9SPIR|nr:AzlD domain-containing protein [Breznakiella homolactica]QQO10904.1 AzlD domain-containing protein [Breznakiella homolactica]
MLTLTQALAATAVMGAVIFFCRAAPFLFFKSRNRSEEPGQSGARSWESRFLGFVETVVPPVAMTVLAFNALAAPFSGGIRDGLPVLAAAAVTAGLHLWKRNSLISIFGGTALYMVINRIIMQYFF